MLGIVPATKVQPAVVVLIHVVEDDEETLVSGILLRAYLIYITVAGNLAWVQTDAALLVAGLLDEAALSLPLYMNVGRQFLQGHWQRFAVLIAVALVLERNPMFPYLHGRWLASPESAHTCMDSPGSPSVHGYRCCLPSCSERSKMEFRIPCLMYTESYPAPTYGC